MCKSLLRSVLLWRHKECLDSSWGLELNKPIVEHTVSRTVKSPRIERVREAWGLILWVWVPEENPGKAISEGQQIPQHIADASTMEWPPQRAAAMEWGHLEPVKQAMCTEKMQSWGNGVLWGSESCESRPRHWSFCTVKVWFWYYLVVTVPSLWK